MIQKQVIEVDTYMMNIGGMDVYMVVWETEKAFICFKEA